MKKILNLLIILFAVNIYCQEQNAEYIEFKTNLLENNTELIIEFNKNCIGGQFIDAESSKDCVYNSPSYLFWSVNGKYYKRKFSNCKIFTITEIVQSELIEIVKSNLKKIKTSEILPVVHKTKNSNGEIETISVTNAHYCISKFVIHSETEKIIKNIRDYDLMMEFVDDGLPNDNYISNQNSILNTIYNLAEKETE